VSRLLPFVVNTLVARRLTPEEFGVPTVRFPMANTPLFLHPYPPASKRLAMWFLCIH
jgi:hypothetical protein